MSAAQAVDAETEAALAHAHKFGLVDATGKIWCIKDHCEQEATLPSLCCEFHLLEHRRGR